MRSLALNAACLIVGLTAVSGSLRAQHATADDIADGGRAYGDNCVVCHGPDGNLIAGIDLGRGLYRREYTDAELVGIILNGIPNTPMPATPRMSAAQAELIVAYLRSLPDQARGSLAAGDASRGEMLFFGKGACDDCHAVDGQGARHGPDLSRIGRERRALEIEDAILNPAAVVQPTARSYRVELANGEVVTGRLLNHDSFSVQLIDTGERLRSFLKSDLRDYGFVATPMPAYAGSLSVQEISDLVSYLTSLQGAEQ